MARSVLPISVRIGFKVTGHHGDRPVERFRGLVPAEIGMRASGRHSAVLHRKPYGLGVLKAVVALALWADEPRPAAGQPQPAILIHNVGVTVDENGGTYTQQVWLQAEPTAVVTISAVSGDPTVVTVHPGTLTFTAANYSTRQEVTYTGVDDSILNGAHRSTTVTYTASGGNYAGVSLQDNVIAHDDEPLRFTVAEGRSYTFNLAFVVSYGCTPVVVTPSSSDPGILSTAPATLTWTEQNSGMQQSLTATFHDNNDLGNGRVTLRLPLTRPCDEGPFFQEIIFTVTDNDTGRLTVDARPACSTTVTDMSVTPSKVLVLDPVPSVEVATEYRVIFDGTGSWLEALPIEPGGRSIHLSFGTFAELRNAYAGFSGFEYRLTDHPDVTARCTWEFDDGGDDGGGDDGGGDGGDDGGGDGGDDGGGDDDQPEPTPPAVSLSASPNPVDEGASVTVAAQLSEALTADVSIPLTLTAGTAEAGDYGSLSGITISAGSTSGTGTISTSEDADTDDETFTVAMGILPPLVRAGSPGSVEVTIRDTTQPNRPPAFEAPTYVFELPENENGRINPVALGSVVAADPDGDEVTYALVSDDGASQSPSAVRRAREGSHSSSRPVGADPPLEQENCGWRGFMDKGTTHPPHRGRSTRASTGCRAFPARIRSTGCQRGGDINE